MRRKIAITFALMLALGAPATVSASAGLPKLAGLELSTYHAQIFGDSPSLHTGTNTITIAISDFPADTALTLTVLGPSGQVVNVPLSPLTVLSGPTDSHDQSATAHPSTGARGMSHMNGTPSSGHGSATENHTGLSHDAPAPTGHGGDDHEQASFNVRGKAVITEPGAWRFVLDAQDHHGETLKAEASVDAEQGGPSRVYLGVTGLIMAGSITYGAVNRRRQPTGGI